MEGIVGPLKGYTDILDECLVQKIEKDSKKKSHFFPLRPSSAGHCARKLAYDLMQFRGYETYDKSLYDPNVFRLLALGHSVEYSALRNFENVESIDIRYKQQAVTLFQLEDTKDIIEGSIDAVFFYENFRAIVDIKSQKDGFSKAYKSRWEETLDKLSNLLSIVKLTPTSFYAEDACALVNELGDDFLTDNIFQLNSYAFSDFLRERNVDHAVIYKYNKNDSRHYELRFKPSKLLFEEVKAKYNYVNKCVEAKAPEKVPKDFTLGSMRCMFCAYQKTCWPNDDAKKAFFGHSKTRWPKRLHPRDRLTELLLEWEMSEVLTKDRGELENLVLVEMEREKLDLVEMPNGHVYEAKYLKSPKPHFELRRTKKGAAE